MAKAEKRSGNYTQRLSLTDPDTGVRRQVRVTATTKRELDRKVAETRVAHSAGNLAAPSSLTVAEFMDRWLKAMEAAIRPASHDRYTRIIERQLVPALGHVPLRRLSPLHVQGWYADLMRDGGLSASTVSLYHGVLHGALDQAVKWRLVPANVCDAVEPPRPVEPEMQTWSAEESKVFLEHVEGDELEFFWYLALYTGMRRGEILATWRTDFDMDRGSLGIRRTMSRGANGIVIGEPKTKAGRRQIALPRIVVAKGRQHFARQSERRLRLGSAWHDDGYVFDRGNGTYLHPNIVQRRFRKIQEKAGLPYIRLHDLRHTAATLMLANGEHPKIVQERLGHSDISITLNRYSHVTPDMQREAADRLERLLGHGS